jgi:hypothetical protein
MHLHHSGIIFVRTDVGSFDFGVQVLIFAAGGGKQGDRRKGEKQREVVDGHVQWILFV